MSGDKFSCFNFDGVNIESRLKNMVDNIGSSQYPAASFASECMIAHESSPVENGTTRAEERKLSSLSEKNTQLIQIINAKDEIIKVKRQRDSSSQEDSCR